MKPSLVMQAEPWTITNKETGVVERTGFTLTYFDLESPHIGRKVGFEPLRISGSDEVVKPHLAAIPGWFHLHFRQRANREGRVATDGYGVCGALRRGCRGAGV